jgi:hypothetical protein
MVALPDLNLLLISPYNEHTWNSWNTTRCSTLNVYRRFGGTRHLRLQGRKINQASTTCKLLNAFLSGLIFRSRRWKLICFFNPYWFSTHFTVLRPRRQDTLKKADEIRPDLSLERVDRTWLRWQRPTATVNYRPALSSERALQNNRSATV